MKNTSAARRAALAPEIYGEWTLRLNGLAIQAERGCPRAPARELADLIDVHAHTITGVHYARDLARWAGAPRVGKSRRDAIVALANEWMRARAIKRAAAISSRCAARYAAITLKRRAYVAGRSVRAQRAEELRQREVSELVYAIRADRAVGRAILVRRAVERGNVWAVAA